MQNPVLYYVTDPMCAWCYGFTPVVRRLWALWRGRLTVNVVVGGLNPYAEEPLQREDRERLAVSWHRVQERTFLPFDYRFFLQKDFVYNTEPACRALLCARHLRPMLTLEILRALHSAFYADCQDITNTQVLVNIMRMFGIQEGLFLTLFESEEMMRQTEEEFRFAADLGVSNFPSTYWQGNNGPVLLTKGYCDLLELEDRLLEQMQQFDFRT